MRLDVDLDLELNEGDIICMSAKALWMEREFENWQYMYVLDGTLSSHPKGITPMQLMQSDEPVDNLYGLAACFCALDHIYIMTPDELPI